MGDHREVARRFEVVAEALVGELRDRARDGRARRRRRQRQRVDAGRLQRLAGEYDVSGDGGVRIEAGYLQVVAVAS